MDKISKTIIIMIIAIIIMIITVIILLKINISHRSIENDNPETLAFTDIEELTNKELFYAIHSQISNYYNDLQNGNQKAIEAISPELPITIESTDSIIKFQSQKMYVLDKIDNLTVYVYGVTRQANIQKDNYLIINLDYQNDTFSIMNSSKEEYDNAINNRVNEKYKEDIYIKENEYNKIKEVQISDFDIVTNYFEDYKYKALHEPEEAFNLVEQEYRNKKFENDLEKYKAYITKNLNRLQDANIVKYGVTKNGELSTYVAIDSLDNYYKITETGVSEYTIILDNYTILDEETIEKYNKASSTDKVISNIDKLIKLINEKNYEQVYSYVNEDFKNRYFANFETFKNYMEQNFFEHNIVGSLEMEVQGQNYIVKVPYKESLSTAAEERTTTIIMKLKEEMNFEIAFAIE